VTGARVNMIPMGRPAAEELTARGVGCRSEPEERPYGTEAVFKDNSDIWFSLTRHR
jgi:hypothetical protein